jgi:hypothetical protein
LLGAERRQFAGLSAVASNYGLQPTTVRAQEEAAGLRDCVPQLQQELGRLVLTTRSVGGRVTSVGLREPGLSAPCQAMFSGL